MAAPGTVTNPANPYKSISGPTWAAGANTNAISAITDPLAAAKARRKALQMSSAGMGQAPPSMHDMYDSQGVQSYGGRGGLTQAPMIDARGATAPQNEGGLGDLYASRTKDPNTGLSLLPSAFDRQQQRAQLQQSGDFEKLGAIDAYYGARGQNNPSLIGAAAKGLRDLDFNRNLRTSLQPQPAMGMGGAGAAVGAGPANPMGMRPATLSPLDATGAEAGIGSPTTLNPFGATTRAKGGATGGVQPYIDGEKGPELWTGQDGKQQMVGVNGPELRTFDEPGFITPHNKLPSRLRMKEPVHRAMGGPTDPSVTVGYGGPLRSNPFPVPPAPTTPFSFNSLAPFHSGAIMPPIHRAGGGRTQGGRLSLFPHGSPLANWENSASDWLGRQGDAIADTVSYPFTPLPVDRTIDSRAHGDTSVPYTPPTANPIPPAPAESQEWDDPILQDEGDQPAAPIYHVPPSLTRYSPYGTAGNSFFDSYIRQPAVQASQAPVAAPQNLMDAVRSRVVPMGMMPTSAPQAPVQNFQTRYGSAGVNFAPKTAESTIEGLPASEYFQRAANRQGDNKFAKTEDDYKKPLADMDARSKRIQRLTQLGLTKNI